MFADSYSSYEDSFECQNDQLFSPGSSSTPKKNYTSPCMPLIRPKNRIEMDTSLMCHLNTVKKVKETPQKMVRKLPVPVFDLEEKFACKICSKSFYHQSALEVHVLLHTSTLPRKQIALKAEKVKLKRNPSRDSGHASAEDSPIENHNSPVKETTAQKSPEQYIHRFELNLTSLDEKIKKKKSTKQYACKMCGKGFNKKTSMRIHQAKHHVHTREFLIFV